MLRRFALATLVLVSCSADEGGGGADAENFSGSLSPAAAAGGAASAAPASGPSGAGGLGSSLGGQGGASASGGASAAVGSSAGAAGEGSAGAVPLAPSAGGSAGADPAPSGSGTEPPAPMEPAEPEPEPDAPPSNPSGPFTSLRVTGGASAAFVCPDGGTFGNPLDGMGAVQTVSAPSTSFFAFIEGPVWVGSLGRLFFSDNASSPLRIWRLDPPFTTPEIFLADSGSNGLALDTEDQLLLADQSDRRIARVNSSNAAPLGDVVPSGEFQPNDLVMRSDRNLYFSDPNSGGRGLYRVAPGGERSGPFTQANVPNAPNAPNGVVLSPDENTLYVGDVQQRFVASFRLLADGAIDTGGAAVFVRTTGDTVDGMAVDCAGNLYVGTRTGVEVYAPDARFIGTVPTGESSNATFGGADRRTLFVTSRSVLKFVTLAVPGLPD